MKSLVGRALLALSKHRRDACATYLKNFSRQTCKRWAAMVDKQVFSKVLVANRGEIAVRIMRSAQELGLKVVAIYEETDKDAFHIMRADEAVCIGSGPRKDYLNIDKIILAAQQTGAQAIHPGYGFLAETPDFPEACTSACLLYTS